MTYQEQIQAIQKQIAKKNEQIAQIELQRMRLIDQQRQKLKEVYDLEAKIIALKICKEMRTGQQYIIQNNPQDAPFPTEEPDGIEQEEQDYIVSYIAEKPNH